MRHARYRGRHRNTSTAARLATAGAVGVVGTIAAAVIAPASAHAASSVQWDRVAHCESGDHWHINTGNGYFGGLQFSTSTWHSFDTNNFASRADLASRQEQIVVANRVLGRQGWHAWPVCSQYRGEPGPAASAHHAHKSHSVHRNQATTKHIDARRYTVKHGDTLASIAHRHHVKGGWKSLYRHNRHVIGSNPSLIRVGEKLTLHTS